MTTRSDRHRDDWPAERIKDERKRAGLTQAQLADALGVTAAAVSLWESGANDISDVNRFKLARVLIDGDLPASLESRVRTLETEVRELRAQVTVLQELVARLAERSH